MARNFSPDNRRLASPTITYVSLRYADATIRFATIRFATITITVKPQMKLSLSQSKIQSSLNFREALQPQSVNKFTLDVCTPSRLPKQSPEFCTQRAEAQALLATQRKSNFSKAFARRGGIKKILVADMVYAIVSHIKTLRSNHSWHTTIEKKPLRSNHRLLSALCVKILSHLRWHG
ncbi:MAG: hypothetical protein KBS65_07245 [Prevotella sp.]|nr:hypothetical protein [Candidatus Equicola stercoris]